LAKKGTEKSVLLDKTLVWKIDIKSGGKESAQEGRRFNWSG